MRDAGFTMVFVGIESPEEGVLEQAGKHANLKMDIKEGVRIIQRHGMEVTAGIIRGLDKESVNIDKMIFELCQEAGIPAAMIGLLTPAPGSELYERFRRDGRLVDDLYIDGSNTHATRLSYRPDNWRDAEGIVSSYWKLNLRLYDPTGKNYFARSRTFIDTLQPGPRFARRVAVKEIRMLGRSLFKQTFESYGWEYLKFIGHTLKKDALTIASNVLKGTSRPFLLPEAVRMAIMGHHFIQTTKEGAELYSSRSK